MWKTNRVLGVTLPGGCSLVRWSKHHLEGSTPSPPFSYPCQEEEEQLSTEEAIETAVQTARGMGYAICESRVEYVMQYPVPHLFCRVARNLALRGYSSVK